MKVWTESSLEGCACGTVRGMCGAVAKRGRSATGHAQHAFCTAGDE